MKKKTKCAKKARKSFYNPNRDTYLDDQGNYVYIRWDPELKRTVKEVIHIGEHGFTSEWAELLDEADHDEDLLDLYEERERDKRFEKAVFQYIRGESSSSDHPLDSIPIRHQATFEETAKRNVRITQLLELMEKLTDAQIDFIYDHFGAMKQLTEIAEECGVKHQAISNRKAKIINRLRKLFEELDEEK